MFNSFFYKAETGDTQFLKCVTKSDRKFQYSYSTDTKTHCLLSGINFVLHCESAVNLF